MRAFLYLVIAFLCIHHYVESYGHFQKKKRTVACFTMTPKHRNIQAQTVECPYKLTFNQVPTQPGETISLTLSGNDAPYETFRGFMIQARTSDGKTVGTFTHGDDSMWNCDVFGEGKSVLSHVEPNDKRSITATWTSPGTAIGEITFYYTVVDVYTTYWAKQEAMVFNIGGETPGSTGSNSNTGAGKGGSNSNTGEAHGSNNHAGGGNGHAAAGKSVGNSHAGGNRNARQGKRGGNGNVRKGKGGSKRGNRN